MLVLCGTIQVSVDNGTVVQKHFIFTLLIIREVSSLNLIFIDSFSQSVYANVTFKELRWLAHAFYLFIF